VGARPRATLQVLADELGVSRTTISNAYNKPEHLSAQLLERVFAAAERLGYSGPDPLARKLRVGGITTVGLIFTDSLSFAVADPASASFLKGVALGCEEARTSLLLIPVVPSDQSGKSAIEQAAVDGIILYSFPDKSPHLVAAMRKGVPVVVVDEPEDVTGVDWIGLDDRQAFSEVARHLADLGHRRVTLIAERLTGLAHDGPVGPKRLARATSSIQRNRIAGFQDVFSALGRSASLQIRETYMSQVDSGTAAGHEAFDANPRATAIACTTDALALGVLIAARQRGIDVPGQVSVTGFDDITEAEHEGLTTVHHSLVAKGKRAAQMLLQGPDSDAPRHEVMPTRLVVRQSTAPPRLEP